jgi:hypothetical protein
VDDGVFICGDIMREEPPAVAITTQQRAFLDEVVRAGATSPAGARPLTDFPRLSARELDALVDRGLLREAGDWKYYAFAQRHDALVPATEVVATDVPKSFTAARVVRMLVFWLIVLLIPVLLIQLTRQ